MISLADTGNLTPHALPQDTQWVILKALASFRDPHALARGHNGVNRIITHTQFSLRAKHVCCWSTKVADCNCEPKWLLANARYIDLCGDPYFEGDRWPMSYDDSRVLTPVECFLYRRAMYQIWQWPSRKFTEGAVRAGGGVDTLMGNVSGGRGAAEGPKGLQAKCGELGPTDT